MRQAILGGILFLALASPALAGSLSSTHGGTASESSGMIQGGGLGNSHADATSTTTGDATTTTGPNSSTTKTTTTESGDGASAGFARESFGAGSEAQGGSSYHTFSFTGF